MANTIVCTDTSEAVDLLESQGLYLKPIAKLNVCVQLPQIKTVGKTISNWEVMEKLKHMVRPEIFLTLKISKSTLEFIRLEGEIENKGKIHNLILKLDGKTIKLSGFSDVLKVRAAESKIGFPSRHDWDSYFRDAKNMNEMKPGERPDTAFLKDLPTRWFAPRRPGKEGEPELTPNEKIVRKVFATFGELRCIDIPMLDPYRKEICANMKLASIQTFSYGQDLTFECFVQYKEYISFVKAMDSLRGMKLLYKGEDKALTANIKVDFDKTKHLSEKNIRRRRIEREKLEALEQERLERVRREKEDEERKKDQERKKKEEEDKEKERRRQEKLQRKEDRRKEREEKRRQKKVEKKQKEEEARMQYKIDLEERRLLIAHRKLESLRLLTELFERVKAIRLRKYIAEKEKELEEERHQQIEKEKKEKEDEEQKKLDEKNQKKIKLEQQEKELRDKIMKNFKAKEEQKQEIQREELRKKISGNVKLKSAVIMKKAVPSAIKRRTNNSDSDDSESSGRSSDSREVTRKRKSQPANNPKTKKQLPSSKISQQKTDTRGRNTKATSGNPSGNRRESSASSWGTSSEDDVDEPNTSNILITRRDTKEMGNSVIERVLKANKMRAWQDPGDDRNLDSPPKPDDDYGHGRVVTIRGRGRGRANVRVRADMKGRVDQNYARGSNRGRKQQGQTRIDDESGPRNKGFIGEQGRREESRGRNVEKFHKRQGRSRSDSENSRERNHVRRSRSRGNNSHSSSHSRSHSRSRSRSRGSRGRRSHSRRRSNSRSRSRDRRGHISRDRLRRRHSPPHNMMPPMVPGPNGMMIPLPPGMPPHPMMMPHFPMHFRPPFPMRGRGPRPPMRMMRGKGMRGGRFPPPPPGFGGMPMFNHFMGVSNQMRDMSGRYAQPMQVDYGYRGRKRHDSDKEDGNGGWRTSNHSRGGRDNRKHRRSRSRTRSDSRGRSRSRSSRRNRSRSESRSRSHERSRSRSHERSKSRSRSHGRSKSRSKSRDKRRSHERSKSRSHERSKSRSHERSKSRSHERSKSRDKRRSHERSKSRSHERSKSRSHERSKSRSHERSKSRSRDKSRSHERSKSKSRDKSKNKSHGRSKSRSCDRSKSKSRDRSRSSNRLKDRNRNKDYSNDEESDSDNEREKQTKDSQNSH